MIVLRKTLQYAGCFCVFLTAVVSADDNANKTQTYINELPEAEKRKRVLPFHEELGENVEPFNVVANVYSVGAKNIGVYLVTTDAGHILIDTGVTEMHENIKRNVKQLGFRVDDIKILLSTHAHFDHIQGHEAMRRATGAEVMAVGDDAKSLALGKDISPLEFEGWEPVKVSKVLEHEDKVRLGDSILVAHNIPGHTQGCTVWTTQVKDHGKSLTIAFFGCRGPNDGVQLKGNKKFPNLVDDTLLGFSRLAALSPDIYLNNHPQEAFEKYGDALHSGHQPNPLLQQQPWSDFVAEIEKGFKARLQ